MVFGAGGGERLFAEILMKYGHKIIIDPETSGFKPSPHWNYFGGLDWGKANPTAVLIGCIDCDGAIYILSEYYLPGLSPKEHIPHLKRLNRFVDTTIFADPSIFWDTHAQNDGSYKAISSLFAEEGITNLSQAPEKHELLGMERILEHWTNLDHREPTLKIVCPKISQYIARPRYGVHNEGCPNLLWELGRARRAESTPSQLSTQNPTEKIVDKDNHLRDCLKYMVLTYPSPAQKTWQQKATEEVAPLVAAGDLTSAMIRYQQREAEAEAEMNNYRPRIPFDRYPFLRGRY